MCWSSLAILLISAEEEEEDRAYTPRHELTKVSSKRTAIKDLYGGYKFEKWHSLRDM